MADQDQEQKWIDTYTAAQVLGITPRAVRDQCARGEFEGAKKFGRLWRIPASEVEPKTNTLQSVSE